MLGNLSLLLNRLTGGFCSQTLCARLAHAFGADCLACRMIGAALRDPGHCADELRAWLYK